jgi:hypothetical protein
MTITDRDVTQVLPAQRRGLAELNPFAKRKPTPGEATEGIPPIDALAAEPLAALEARNISAWFGDPPA